MGKDGTSAKRRLSSAAEIWPKNPEEIMRAVARPASISREHNKMPRMGLDIMVAHALDGWAGTTCKGGENFYRAGE